MSAASGPRTTAGRRNSGSVLASALSCGRIALCGIGVFSAFLNLLALTGAIFMLQIYDRVLPNGSVPTLVGLSLLAVTFFGFYGLLDLLRGRVLVRLGGCLDATIREGLPMQRGRAELGQQQRTM